MCEARSTFIGCFLGGTIAAAGVAAPSISYAASPIQLYLDVLMTPASVSSTGGSITSYADLGGALAAVGLTLNTSTGAITGTPTSAFAATNFTVRATGPGGTGDAVVSIASWAPSIMGVRLLEWEHSGGTLWQDDARSTPAAANNDPLAVIDDVSAGANHLRQGTAGSRPTLKTAQVNGRKAFSFDGGDFIRWSGPLGSPVAQPYTRWLVMKFTGTPPAATEIIVSGITSNTSKFARLITSGFLQIQSATALTTDDTDDGSAWHLYRCVFNGASSALHKDGTSIHTGSAGTSTFNGTILGAGSIAGAAPASNGTLVAEHFVTTGEDAADVALIKGYIAGRYGLTIA